MLRSSSKDRTTEGNGLFMSKNQMGDYLNDLRSNRPSRPTGARPPPSSFLSKRYSTSNLSATPSAIEQIKQEELPIAATDPPPRCASAQSFHRRPSAISTQESRRPSVVPVTASQAGRPLARPSSMRLETDTIQEDLPYLERGGRWLERQEVHSLRRALDDMDSKDEDKVFYDAQNEAAELVWKHQNPNAPQPNPDAPYKNPDLNSKVQPSPQVSYKSHLRKTSVHARTASWAQTAHDIQTKQMKRRSRESSASRSVSGGSKSSSAPSSRIPSDSSLKVPESPTTPLEENETFDLGRQPRHRAVQFAEPGIPEAAGEPQHEKRGIREMIRNRTPSPSKVLLHLKREEKQGEKPKENSNTRVPSLSAATKTVTSAGPGHFRNPFSRVRESKGRLSRVNTDPTPLTRPLNRVEIQRNPPSQSHNPLYTVNGHEVKLEAMAEEVNMKDGKEVRGDDILKATKMSLKDRSDKLPMPTMVSDAPGRPIVSFRKDWKPKEIELQQEISMVESSSRKQQSQPAAKTIPEKSLPALHRVAKTANSIQVPGRERERASPPPVPAPLIHADSEPILPSSRSGPMAPVPTISISDSPPVPSISISNGPPTVPVIAINGSGPAVPSISVNDFPAPLRDVRSQKAPSISVSTPSFTISPPTIAVTGSAPPTRPLPTPSASNRRPLPQHFATAPVGPDNRSHFTPSGFSRAGGSTALCDNCALPIAGRIVSAAGVRFHPECFRCHHCSEGLECVAFYPEPESCRLDRVNRIRDRMSGHYVEDKAGDFGRPGISEVEDGDESLRFYCHLDYHEFFSPRCKNCKTPIEGEVVVACGAEWHAGHFFCAQCGDPFDAQTPFVEKEGYAWCVNCHTNRYSTKCKKCRKPVTTTVVKALGAEWHEACFCCTECSGPFADGRYFIRPGGTDPYCPGCEERRLKA